MSLDEFAGTGTFPRGIHPPERKSLAAEKAIEVVDPPDNVQIALLQHTGAPCAATVKGRQSVAMGDCVGSVDAFVSAPVHASIAGIAAKVGVATLSNGRHVATLPIKADGEQLAGPALWEEIFGGSWPSSDLEQYSPGQIVKSVREAGIVGMGGAAFPTHVKLTLNDEKPIDTLLINGCECEPYLTADYRLMLEAPEPVVTGALLAGRAVKAKDIAIVIEDNKPEAARVLKPIAEAAGVRVSVVKTKYPMGGERQFIPAVLDREVPTGGLPLDVGVVVMNVGTTAAVARAVVRGRPVTHRVVTVSGAGVVEPKNLLVPIGISCEALLSFCGGLKPDAERIVAGGPMMGFTLGNVDTPVTKGTSGITVLTHEDVKATEQQSCIRCGRCVDACPLNLVPTKIATASKHQDWDLARRYHLMACMECGCCAYICPSSIPLVQLIRTGKARLPRD